MVLTGATGLLGSVLLPRLAATNDVHALVRRIPPSRVSGVSYHMADFGADWNLDSLPDSVDSIVHLAQSSRFRDFPSGALDVFRVNVDSTARLLDFAHRSGAKRFVYASSGGVYESGADEFHENSPIVAPGKLGYYLGSKLCGELLAQSYVEKMQVVVLRPFFMYGAGQDRSMLIPRLVDNVREGRPIVLQGEEGIRINPIHVSDAASAVTAALKSDSSATYNIAGNEIFSLRAVVDAIGRTLGVQPVYEFVQGESNDLVGSNALMAELLHVPRMSFEEGVKELL